MGGVQIFNFKLNLTIIKIILLLTIVTFFLPFFAVSCGEIEFSLSGFEMSFGKMDGNFQQEGNPLALILVILPIILLVLTFLMTKKKKGVKKEINEDNENNIEKKKNTREAKLTFLLKNLFIVAPIFNIFAGITLRFVAKIMLKKRIADYLGELNTESFSILKEAVNLRVRYGFVLYIFFNILILLLSSVNYFLNVKKDN